jgi:hypothetical protein
MGSATFCLPASVTARSSRARWFITGWLIAGPATFATRPGSPLSQPHAADAHSQVRRQRPDRPRCAQWRRGYRALGLALHYFNAFLFTAFFFVVASRARRSSRSVLVGAFMGLASTP